MDHFWSWTLAILATCLSCLASCCLLCALHSNRRENSHKVMWRQLWIMASADGVFSSLCVGNYLINALSTPSVRVITVKTHTVVWLCEAVDLAYSVGFYASIIVETHLAICAVAAVFRRTASLRLLRRALVLVWPLAVTLSICDVLFVQVTWEADEGCTGKMPDRIGLVSMAVCMVTAFVCYMGAVMGAISSGQVVRERIWKRTRYYLLAVLLCCLPNAIRMGRVRNAFQTQPVMHLLALVLFNLKGLVNALIYAVQSHYVRRMVARRGQTVISAPGTTKHDPSFLSVNLGSVEVVDVVPITATAREQSEREIARMMDNGSRPRAPFTLPWAECVRFPRSPATSSAPLQGVAASCVAQADCSRVLPPPSGPVPGMGPPLAPRGYARAPMPSLPVASLGPVSPSSNGDQNSDEVFLDCFEEFDPTSPDDVRQGLHWTMSLADGLTRREQHASGRSSSQSPMSHCSSCFQDAHKFNGT